VYNDYKLTEVLRKEELDPFCRWTRINIPLDDERVIETTIGQLNFFKGDRDSDYRVYRGELRDRDRHEYLQQHVQAKIRQQHGLREQPGKTRKKREELSISACKCIKKENVNIKISFM
jgi:hypothetical protein